MDGARPTQQTARRRHNTPFAVHACTECTGTIYNELLGRMLAGLASGQFPARGKATWPLKKRSGRFPPPGRPRGFVIGPGNNTLSQWHPSGLHAYLPAWLAGHPACPGRNFEGGRACARARVTGPCRFFLIFFFSPSHNSFSLVLSLSCGAQSYFYLPDNPWLCAPVVLVRRIASSPCLAVGYMYLPMYSIRRTDRLYTRDGVFGTEVS